MQTESLVAFFAEEMHVLVIVDLVSVAQTEFKFHVAVTIFECVHKVIFSE
jgi:hypothetical protein